MKFKQSYIGSIYNKSCKLLPISIKQPVGICLFKYQKQKNLNSVISHIKLLVRQPYGDIDEDTGSEIPVTRHILGILKSHISSGSRRETEK